MRLQLPSQDTWILISGCTISLIVGCFTGMLMMMNFVSGLKDENQRLTGQLEDQKSALIQLQSNSLTGNQSEPEIVSPGPREFPKQ